MKRFIWVLFCPLLFSYCGTEPLIGEFALDYSEDFEIPAGIAPLGSTFIVIQNIQSNSDLIFAANGFTANDVTEIKTSFVSLQAINPSTEDFDFLREANLFIETATLPRIDVGYRDQIFNASGTLDLIPAITDLTEYLKSEEFNLVLELQPTATTPTFITTRLRVQFQVFVD